MTETHLCPKVELVQIQLVDPGSRLRGTLGQICGIRSRYGKKRLTNRKHQQLFQLRLGGTKEKAISVEVVTGLKFRLDDSFAQIIPASDVDDAKLRVSDRQLSHRWCG